jgi:hypothetical protein
VGKEPQNETNVSLAIEDRGAFKEKYDIRSKAFPVQAVVALRVVRG